MDLRTVTGTQVAVQLNNVDILRKAEFSVSSWKIARAANPTRALQTHDNGLQRVPVISYEELSGDRRIWRFISSYLCSEVIFKHPKGVKLELTCSNTGVTGHGHLKFTASSKLEVNYPTTSIKE